jgi:hypothetical protein
MKSVLLTTPYPTVEEVARWSGVSPKRTKELIRLAKAIVAGELDRKRPASVGAAKKKSSVTGSRRSKPARRK